MGTRLTTIQRFRWLLVAVMVALLTAPVATTASAASPTTCRVRYIVTGKSYGALQAAVDAAGSGDKLLVRGTCIGTTIVGKDLVIVGIETPASGRPMLSGVGRVRVLTIKTPARVRLRDIEIVRGHGRHGGAILNRGHLVLRDVVVSRSSSPAFWPGGGVANLGSLTLNGASSIRDNGADQGGGVENHKHARLILNGSSTIASNGATYAGGVYNAGTLVMNGSSAISGNAAEDIGGVTNLGTIVMNDSSTITRNEVSYDEGKVGGVHQFGGEACGPGCSKGPTTLTLNDASSISGNQASGVSSEGSLVRMNDSSSISGNQGGGVGLESRGRLILNDASSIHANTGGGVWVQDGRVSLNDSSSISGNSSYTGAGVYLAARGRLTLRDASSIWGNATVGYTDEDRVVPPGPGGGVYLGRRSRSVGVTCGPGGNVYGNTPDDCLIE